MVMARSFLLIQAATIKKNKNTFAKLQRERKKKQKADEKRQRRLERKALADDPARQEELAGGLMDSEQGDATAPESDNADVEE